MKIGELARATNTPAETIRFYEREGLLPPPARTESNYRAYEQQHVERLQFIRACRSLDMSLDEVRVLLQAKDTPAASCGDVDRVLDEHIEHVSRRLDELRSLETELKALRSRCCEQKASPHCGILAALDAAQPSPSTRSHLQRTHSSA